MYAQRPSFSQDALHARQHWITTENLLSRKTKTITDAQKA